MSDPVEQLVLEFNGLRLVFNTSGQRGESSAEPQFFGGSPPLQAGGTPASSRHPASGARAAPATPPLRDLIQPGPEDPGPVALELGRRLYSRSGPSPAQWIRDAYKSGREARLCVNGQGSGGSDRVFGKRLGKIWVVLLPEKAAVCESQSELAQFVGSERSWAYFVTDTQSEGEAFALGSGLFTGLPARFRA